MKGLDVTVLKFSEVRHENRVFRFDSQFYSKAAIETERTLKCARWETLGDVSASIESFGAYALTNQFSYTKDGVPYLRCLNIKNGFVDIEDSLFISKEAHKLLSKSAIEPEMVLLTMSGSVGDAAVALPSWEYPINSNQDVAKITVCAGVSPYFLTAFINSRYGRTQAERLPVGSVQQHIFLWMLEELVVVRRFSDGFESSVASTVKNAYEQSEKAKRFFSDAEATLTGALGLDGWRPPEPLTYMRRASEVFAAHRFDAEHFRPKFAALISKMQEHGEVVRLGDCIRFCERGRQPLYAKDGLPVINSRHVRANNVVLDDENRFATEDATQLKLDEDDRLTIKQGDLLINGSQIEDPANCSALIKSFADSWNAGKNVQM